MTSFIFVSIICIGSSCEFMSSTVPVTEIRCDQMKKIFFNAPFKEEVTMAAAQCMAFKSELKDKENYQ